MSGRLAGWLLLAALAVGLVLQIERTVDRIAAAVALQRAETASLYALRMGQAGAGILRANLDLLRRAAERDPVEIGIPIAIGSVHRLLGSPQAAIESYRKANELEPRPETYLNLGRAQLEAGRRDEARQSFETALELDPLLAREVPPDFKPGAQSP